MITEEAAELIAVAMAYPFARPDHSFLFVDGEVQALACSGAASLNAALSQRGAVPMAERIAVLAYGANAAPERLRLRTKADAAVASQTEQVGRHQPGEPDDEQQVGRTLPEERRNRRLGDLVKCAERHARGPGRRLERPIIT